MKYLGQLTLSTDNRIIIDAEPHVMARIRPMFNGAITHPTMGKYTHRPISVTFNQSHSKDLMWINERYPLLIPMSLYADMKTKSQDYDRLLTEVSRADQNNVFKISPKALPLALPLREHQIKFYNMFMKVKKMLLADKLGLGKTSSAIGILSEPHMRPAIIIVPPHLCSQWGQELHRFLPDLKFHTIKGFKNYKLPSDVDVILTTYNRLAPWEDTLGSMKFNTVIMDEVHELRHENTAKRELCKIICKKADYCLGMSGTPIYNKGSEMFSVMDVISDNCLGSREEFIREWCDWDSVREPTILHSFLKSKGLMLRRMPEDVGLVFGIGKPSKMVYTLDSDLNSLKEIKEVTKNLALSVLSGNVGDSDLSAREFDFKLRQATGIAKARSVAEFVKMILAEGEKVVLSGWHRECYRIWMEELKDYKPVLYTGSENTKDKEQAKKDFIEGDSQVFILSLRSGTGLDGLQRVCNTVVFGELDWSPHVMDQVLGRLDRDGQTKHVRAFYLTVNDGSDPIMMSILNVKRSQHDGIIEGQEIPVEILDDHGGGATKERIMDMAKKYLESIGEEVPEAVPEVGLLGDLSKALRKFKITTSTEADMQLGIHQQLPKLITNAQIDREFYFTKRSRIDFLVTKGNERIGIECKNVATKKASVYAQVRRYVEEGNISGLILIAPWHGASSFKVDGVPVIVIDTNLTVV